MADTSGGAAEVAAPLERALVVLEVRHVFFPSWCYESRFKRVTVHVPNFHQNMLLSPSGPLEISGLIFRTWELLGDSCPLLLPTFLLEPGSPMSHLICLLFTSKSGEYGPCGGSSSWAPREAFDCGLGARELLDHATTGPGRRFKGWRRPREPRGPTKYVAEILKIHTSVRTVKPSSLRGHISGMGAFLD